MLPFPYFLAAFSVQSSPFGIAFYLYYTILQQHLYFVGGSCSMDYVSLTYYNILLVYPLVQGYNSSNHKFLFPHLNPVVLHLFFCIMCQSPTLSFEKNVKETFLRSLTNLPFPALLLLTAES